jgi:N-acetylmuramoyl-L-alanine amidase
MAKLDYLFIHSTATPEGRKVTREDIEQWHRSPRNNRDGSVTYLGRKYKSRDDLPEEKLNGRWIHNLNGRGWRGLGYNDLLLADGSLENLTPFNQDAEVDPWEIANGVAGFNGRSRHLAYVGGLREEVIDDHWEPADTRTPNQLYHMEVYVRYMIMRHPHIQVGGHNQVAKRACPCFDVPEWLESINIKQKNIYHGSN